MKEQRIKKAEAVFSAAGPVVRNAILRQNSFCSKDVSELAAAGYITKIKTGYYAWSSTFEKLSDIEIVSLVIPNCVFTLKTAAQFHNLTSVIPATIDIALPSDMRNPVLPDYPPVVIYKSINKIYKIGMEEIPMRYNCVKMYDRERTVCEFFRMRLQFGEDIALEILKNYMSGTKNIQKLYEYADAIQIKGVIKPYVEALI